MLYIHQNGYILPGILESFSRGLHVAATYKLHRPTPHHLMTAPEPITDNLSTPINNYQSSNEEDEVYINVSSTVMPTLSGGLQRVGRYNTISKWKKKKKLLNFQWIRPLDRSVPRRKCDRPVICRWPIQKGIDIQIHRVPVQTNQPAHLLLERQSIIILSFNRH